MGLSNRLRERREQLGLTQGEVTNILGITPGAVGNYENGVSTPKADILFKVFDALKCDANYLFQDEMKNLTTEDSATPYEMENLVKKYRTLDNDGKETVDFILNKEYKRCSVDYIVDSSNGTRLAIETAAKDFKASRLSSYINATRAISDSSKEDQQHDEDLMNQEP